MFLKRTSLIYLYHNSRFFAKNIRFFLGVYKISKKLYNVKQMQELEIKNKRIAITRKNTIQRHSDMDRKILTVKIKIKSCSSLQKEALQRIFLEQKWYKNYIINWAEQSKENNVIKFDTRIVDITKKDKELNNIPIHITYLSAQSRQSLIARMYANIKTLKKLKESKYQKCGKLKYSKDEKSIEFKQYGKTHKILSLKKVRLAGIPGSLNVSGLKQIKNVLSKELANARLIKKASGFYIQFIYYISKKQSEVINENLGIDFGCSSAFTFSTGEKFFIKVPETERLKRHSRLMSKKQKGSKNWYKEKCKLEKEYERIENRKKDLANKLIARIKNYNHIIIQDEQLPIWKQNKHGRAVQYSILGRVKARLKLLSNTVILSKNIPTTKLCYECGLFHDELKLWDRQFKCSCGVNMDRDIHSAKSMIWFFENNIGVERIKYKRVEIEALVNSALRLN